MAFSNSARFLGFLTAKKYITEKKKIKVLEDKSKHLLKEYISASLAFNFLVFFLVCFAVFGALGVLSPKSKSSFALRCTR